MELFAPGRQAEILESFLQKRIEALRLNITSKKATRRFGPVNASGRLANSLRLEVAPDTGAIYAVGYARFVEQGRGPGKPPPVAVLIEWALAKRIIPKAGGTLRGFAFAVQNKIRREGTDIFKEGGRSGVLSDAINAAALTTLRQELAVSVAQQATSFLLPTSPPATD